MDLQLEGKRVFVSGSTQGIGHAVARTCLAEGATVIVNGRTGAGVDAAVARLRAEVPDGTVSGLAADLADAGEVASLLERLGPVDVLVNNVGTFGVESFAEVTDETWRHYLDVNLMSGVRLSRHVLGEMLDREWGRIIFIGTESAVDVPADMVHYGATKAAALALANGLAKLTRGTGVTVNTVLGGPTYSDGVQAVVEAIAAAHGSTAEDLKAGLVPPTSLVQRFLDPTEIASLVAYLASPLSSATNGAAVRADGGVLTTVS